MSRAINERTWDATRRCLNLFFIFNLSNTPLSMTRIISDAEIGYGGDNPDSEKTKFKRDRALLRSLGVHIRRVSIDGMAMNEDSLWELDRAHTYIGNLEGVSTPTLERLTRELATVQSDPIWASNRGFSNLQQTLGNELARRGDEGFAQNATLAPTCPGNEGVALLWSLYESHVQAQITYQNANGETHLHTVSIYGFFVLEAKSYFVGHSSQAGQIRTFLTDRVKRVKAAAGSYEIPPDFNIRDYLYLPFDFSSTPQPPAVASFAFSAAASEEQLLLVTRERGQLSRPRSTEPWLWTVEVRDIPAAATFALAHTSLGLRPISPEPLVQTWSALIAKAVEANA